MLKSSKEHIFTSDSAHFGSKDFYASFGNKANYDSIEYSLVSQYVAWKPVADSNGMMLSKMLVADLKEQLNLFLDIWGI